MDEQQDAQPTLDQLRIYRDARRKQHSFKRVERTRQATVMVRVLKETYGVLKNLAEEEGVSIARKVNQILDDEAARYLRRGMPGRKREKEPPP